MIRLATLRTIKRMGPSKWVRNQIATNVRAALGGDEEELADYGEPPGDAGLFGPSAPAWTVHADLASMLYGGFAALMLQTLSPRTMAGVAQHSNYRVDPTGRLKRTARFVAGTTYGGSPFVNQLFAEVVAVHSRVKGQTDDGSTYSAQDPDLLTWVHVTEVSNFLRAYLRYGTRTLTEAQQDQYFNETAVIAERLGAADIPRSRSEVAAYFERVRKELRATPDAHAAVHFLRTNTVGMAPQSVILRLANGLVQKIVVGAAIDLLPNDARAALNLGGEGPMKTARRRLLAHLLARTFRWALGPSKVVETAAHRIAQAPT